MGYKGTDMAVMTVTSKYKPDKPKECLECYGTASIEHPGVRMVAMERGSHYIGGSLEGLDVPVRDFPCKTPAETRESLPDGADVVAFQCRNPVHRAHYELFTRALDAPNVAEDAVVLVHPTCGPTQEEDIPGPVRHKTYEVLQDETKDTPSGKKTRWAYLPYDAHGGPARGHPPHDDPQELRVHAFHHRPRHGRLQVFRHGRGLLWRFRSAGPRQGQGRRAWRAGGALAQPGVHCRGRLRHS